MLLFSMLHIIRTMLKMEEKKDENCDDLQPNCAPAGITGLLFSFINLPCVVNAKVRVKIHPKGCFEGDKYHFVLAKFSLRA